MLDRLDVPCGTRPPSVPDHDTADELRDRRLGWTRGVAVRLADRRPWYLPRFAPGLLLTNALLVADLIEASAIASGILQDDEGGRGQAVQLMLYHAHLANMAVHLLQANYELPDDAWKRLLGFDSIVEMFFLTSAIAHEVDRTVSTWMPFSLTHGADGRDQLLRN